MAHLILPLVSCLAFIYLQNGGGDAAAASCCGTVILVIVIVVAASIYTSNQQIKAVGQARSSYQASLTQLKSHPTDANLRQRTLELGRIYSNLTRNRKGVTIFDEIALMNDINAACAGATFTTNQPIQSSQSIEERLARLSELRSKGLIDVQEYDSRRRKILDDI
jgi:hypothetical protein